MTGLLILARPHVSLLDGPRLAWWLTRSAGIRGAVFPVDPAYARHPVWSRLLHTYGFMIGGHRMIALDTGSPFGLRSLTKALQHGQTVVLFPQGTGLRNGPARPDQPGVQWLLERVHPRVLPVTMDHRIFIEQSTEEVRHA
ncbi:1-acyl-sn-glycerol-3-phosphate acyltransferase [Acidithiobacillus sp. CV18-2]|nr:1-acyl-sn-glycerol-3-phosphate acyltransferase [Acidithiobacillus sp. CV18-3]MBU2757499.1 1-acyl-sn-glycerol-3-phosphate acyltransferase [Acidithiobacillus sp. BN09-2]MBU2777219.1 1-acyl-sn-glycerol-3-phosphate acyltransferase [Acidithiobacillus sp. CV18-2]MBU2799931.1 1-acyl-sn-glycerol-3-phosphate acyltransferase [Acidithiobacillus sp. VAN18-4]